MANNKKGRKKGRKKDLGRPVTTKKTRQSPDDYVRALNKKYKWIKNAPLELLMFWDKQDKKNGE